MKRLVCFSAVILAMVPVGASAQHDPESDAVGVFFDLSASTVGMGVSPNVPFSVFVILLNPSSVGVWGFEFGYWLEDGDLSGRIIRLLNALPPNAIDFGENTDLVSGDYVVGLADPLPGDAAVVLVQWQFMLLVPSTIYIQLGPSRFQSISGEPPAYEGGGVIIPMSLASSCAGEGRAMINEYCGLEVESNTFGAVKALYR
jgi:hypothetical protein